MASLGHNELRLLFAIRTISDADQMTLILNCSVLNSYEVKCIYILCHKNIGDVDIIVVFV